MLRFIHVHLNVVSKVSRPSNWNFSRWIESATAEQNELNETLWFRGKKSDPKDAANVKSHWELIGGQNWFIKSMTASGDVINQQATSTSALADPVGGMKDGSSTRHSKNIKEVFVTRLVNGRLVSKSTKSAECVLKRDQTYLCKHFLRGGTSCLNIWRQGGAEKDGFKPASWHMSLKKSLLLPVSTPDKRPPPPLLLLLLMCIAHEQL